MAKSPKDPSTARMVQLMGRLAPQEGYNLSPLDDVRFLRSNRPLTRTPVLYEPGIVILCQGRKRGYLGDEVYVYDARHVDEPSHLRGFREARGATGYCSQNSPVLHFGVPAGRAYDIKAVFMDGRYFIAKGVEAPEEVLIDPNAPLH